jgi:Ca2+-binding RTX toxin-like protein
MKTIVAAVAAVSLFGVAVPAAQGSTVTFGADGALVVTAAPGERNSLGIQAAGDGSGRVVVYEGTPELPVTGPADRCEQFDGSVTCAFDPAAGVRLDLGDGDDWAYVSSDLPAAMPVFMAGGAGDDRLQASFDGQPTTFDGGPGNDKLDGGTGIDTLIGGDGDDALDGKGASDRLDGGAGDDLLNGDGNKEAAPDLMDGGPGYDRIESEWQQSTYNAPPVPLAVTLGGGADDGRPGEGDDVRNVERVITSGPSRMVGTDAAEHLEVFQITGAGELVGVGGNDTLKGADGPDRLEGGPGDDDLDAGFGDDTIVGGPGRDNIAGDRRGGDCGPVWCKLPFGNDAIDARDGEQDSVMCGAGTDTVQADAIDVVAPDCEQIVRGGAAAPGATAPGGASPALSAAVTKTKLAKALSRGLKVRVIVPGAGRVTAKAKNASGSAKAKKAGSTTVVLRFNKAARRTLRTKRSVNLTVTVRFTPASGQALDGTVKLTLKR